jgi:hypothetical protein
MLPTFHFKKEIARKLLEGEDTFATVLHVILLAAYGPDLYEADPLEIYARVKEDFGAVIPEEGENRLNALLMALQTDAFYQSAQAFESISSALHSGDIGDEAEGVFDGITLPEVLWGLYEVKLNREDEDPLSPEVEALIARTIADECSEQGLEYVEQHLEAMKVDLHTQLAELGVPGEDLHCYLV